jgi:hypothetical protein
VLAEIRRLGLFLRQDGESLKIVDRKGDLRVSRLPAGLLREIGARRDEILSALADERDAQTPAQVGCFD